MKPASPATGAVRIRRVGVVLLVALALLTWLKAPWAERLQSAWFDAHQAMAPRQVGTLPVTVVAIDQKSLLALGQWPWPRTRLARLVDIVNQAGPAAIGLDVLMPEPDALSPESLLAQAPLQDRTVAAALQSLRTNDAVLAASLAAAPVVLVIAAALEHTGMPLRAVPVTLRNTRDGSDAAPDVVRYAGVVTSIAELDRQATGRGLISVDTTRGIVRRISLISSINGTLVPTLAVEMLRVAYGAPSLQLSVSGKSVTRLAVGELDIPTEADGAVRVYFSPHRPDRFVSAVDVLEGKVDPALLRRQMVLIGPTAIGLHDLQATPIGQLMSGSEIHAQLLENLIDGTWLRRPAWASGAEALALLLLGALLLRATPRLKPVTAAQIGRASCRERV